MAKFLDELSENEDEVYLKTPTFFERLSDYKETVFDLITMTKLLSGTMEDYVVPESAVLDRMGLRPSGRCVQMKVYTLSKRHFVIVFITFISLFLITSLLSLAGPPIILTTLINSSYFSLPSQKINVNEPFELSSPALTAFNQQIWLLTNVRISKSSSSIYVLEKLQVQVTTFAVGEDGSGGSGISNHTHQRTLTCRNDLWCDPMVVLHLGYLSYSRFKAIIKFTGLESSTNKVEDINFEFKTYNPIFTQVEIWFRFAFLLLTFLVTCAYSHVLRRYHVRNWTIEQKWMSVLLPLLLFYNNPLFPLNFILNSWVPGMLDSFFQASYLCTLLLFWLCVYHGIRTTSERRPFLRFYFPKLLICGLLWLAAVTLGCWQQYNELRDPTYQYEVDLKNFLGMKIFFFIMAALYFLYLGFLFIRACTELHSKPYANKRLKFLTGITTCVIVISVAIFILRFGTSILENNFVAQFSTKYRNSAEFACFYALLNYYIYTMAFVYSPSKETATEPVFRADTGFTLLNESDEDVLYGSDDEEIPLRRPNGYRRTS